MKDVRNLGEKNNDSFETLLVYLPFAPKVCKKIPWVPETKVSCRKSTAEGGKRMLPFQYSTPLTKSFDTNG